MQQAAVAQPPRARRVVRDLADRRWHRERPRLAHELAEQVARVAVGGEGLHVRPGVRCADQHVVVGQHLAHDFGVRVHQPAVFELGLQILFERQIDHRLGRRRSPLLGDLAQRAAQQRLVALQRHPAHERVRHPIAQVARARRRDFFHKLRPRLGVAVARDLLLFGGQVQHLEPGRHRQQHEVALAQREVDVDRPRLHLRPDPRAELRPLLHPRQHRADQLRRLRRLEQRRERRGDAELQRQLRQHVHPAQHQAGVVELRDDLQHPVPDFAECAREGADLFVPCETARHRLPVVVDIHIGRAETARSRLQALGQDALHLDDLRLGRLALKRLLAHHPHPNRAVPDQRRDVDAQPRLQRPQVVVERLPGPVDPILERRHRQVLDLAEHPAEPIPLLLAQRRERQRAVPGHDRRHPVLQRRARLPVPAQLRVVVRVRVDEARRGGVAVGVDLTRAALGHAAHAGDPPAANADLSPIAGHPRSVVDVGVADDEVHLVVHRVHARLNSS